MTRETVQQLDTLITEMLLNEIRTGRFKNASILPPETELAEYYNVSRTTIREVLASLEREGFISRRRRVGTMINKHVIDINTRIDLEKEFLDIIRDEGYEAHARLIYADNGTATEEEAEKLKIAVGDPVIHVAKIAYADDIPTIYCIDTIAQALIRDTSYPPEVFKEPIFSFINKYCYAEVYMALSELHAENATEKVAEYLEIEKGTAVLHLKEAEYDFFGIPVLYSSEYYREGQITHTILRKKIH